LKVGQNLQQPITTSSDFVSLQGVYNSWKSPGILLMLLKNLIEI